MNASVPRAANVAVVVHLYVYVSLKTDLHIGLPWLQHKILHTEYLCFISFNVPALNCDFDKLFSQICSDDFTCLCKLHHSNGEFPFRNTPKSEEWWRVSVVTDHKWLGSTADKYMNQTGGFTGKPFLYHLNLKKMKGCMEHNLKKNTPMFLHILCFSLLVSLIHVDIHDL
jgi:hypothetical protein